MLETAAAVRVGTAADLARIKRSRAFVSIPRDVKTIDLVTPADFDALLPLVRAYCDFYETAPIDEALLDLSRALIADPEREGIQLIARDERAHAVGFATVFWSWDTTEGSRIGIMNDLYVAPEARGSGLADRLIAECVERCAARGASRLEWQTGPENLRAQAVYDRVRGKREPWLVYTLPTSVGE
jgi:GNAT superfamily N-acetyltransferase